MSRIFDQTWLPAIGVMTVVFGCSSGQGTTQLAGTDASGLDADTSLPDAWDAADEPPQDASDIEPETGPQDAGDASVQPDTSSDDATVPDAQDAAGACLGDDDCDPALDDDFCDGPIRCLQGHCQNDPSLRVFCDPTNDSVCVANLCNPATGTCSMQQLPDGTPCTDGKFCTGPSGCAGGMCQIQPKACPASCETCDESLEACVLQADFCLIDGACHGPGDSDPNNPCQLCDTTAPTSWASAPAGTSCPTTGACSASAGCDGAGVCEQVPVAPGTPQAWYPRSGVRLGSFHAPGSWQATQATLRWKAVSAGGCATPTYEVQLDDNCQPGALDACAFDSPEQQISGVDATTLTTAPLPVGSVVPVGVRYYWRVRACRGSACSPWSDVLYFDLSRPKNDLNGDGYSELIAGGANLLSGRGELFVYFGTPGGLSVPDIDLIDPDTPSGTGYGRAAATGDLNADGFSDLVVVDSRSGYRALVYLGSSAGVATTPTTVIGSPIGPPDWFGCEFAPYVAIDDLNADGFADLMIAADSNCAARVGAYIYFSEASGPPGQPSLAVTVPAMASNTFPIGVVAGGDVNTDGVTDFAVAEYDDWAANSGNLSLVAGSRTGAIHVYSTSKSVGVRALPMRLGPSLSGDASDDLFQSYDPYPDDYGMRGLSQGTEFMTLPPVPLKEFGKSFAFDVDANNDGQADLFVGAPGTWVNSDKNDDAVYFFKGPLQSTTPTAKIVLQNSLSGTRFGWEVAVLGDIDGDGYGDAAASAPNGYQYGAVYLFRGSSGGPLAPQRIPNPSYYYGFGLPVH